MADVVDNCEFCLPSQFLNEEESMYNNGIGGVLKRGKEYSTGFHSVPARSSINSRLYEEELLAELSRQLAGSSARYSRNVSAPERTWVGSGYIEQPFRNSPTPPQKCNDDPLGAIYAAAGKVARKKMSEECLYEINKYPEMFQHDNRSFCSCEPDFRQICPNGVGTHNISQANMFRYLSQCQVIERQYQNSQILNGRRSPAGNDNERCLSPRSNAFLLEVQRQQQQNLLRSAMRGLSVKESVGTQKKPTGTGVFLPRKYGNLTEPRTKPVRFGERSPSLSFQGGDVLQPSVFADDASQHNRGEPSIPDVTYKFATGLGFPKNVGNEFSDATLMSERWGMMRGNEMRLPQEWNY